MIKFKGVRKTYDDGFQALKNLNLDFGEGEIHVLIGPSGCGKTTSMKLINRLIRPTKGEIWINNKNIAKINPVKLRRSIGYVIQNIGLFPHMTISKNVSVVPRLLGWSKQQIDKRTDELLELVGLDPETYRNRYPSELSGGQQQRIGVIRALAADPDIILMDEPFSALDPISREQLQDELLRLQQKLNKTIVFVTHDMDEAIKIADSIHLMKDGEVVQEGRPEHILRHPANEFVEDFVGKKRMANANQPASLTVEDVMADHPVTAYPERGLAEALKIMEKKKVDSLLVVDRDNRIRGHASIYQILDEYKDENKSLSDIVKPLRHKVKPGTPLNEALQMMTEHQLRYVPIVDENDEFSGMVTRGSLVRHLAEVYPEAGEEAFQDG